MAKTTRNALKEAAEVVEPSDPAPLKPSDLAGLRVKFATDVMMRLVEPCFDPRHVGVKIEWAAEFAVRAVDALIAELCKPKEGTS